MMNKKGFLTRDFVVAGVFLMGVIAIMILMVQGVATNYDRTDLIDESFSEKYDKLDNVTSSVGILLAQTSSGDGLSFKGAFDVAFGAAFVGIQLIFGTLNLFSSVFVNVLSDFGVDSRIGSILFIILFTSITVTIIYTWLSSVSRGKI